MLNNIYDSVLVGKVGGGVDNEAGGEIGLTICGLVEL